MPDNDEENTNKVDNPSDNFLAILNCGHTFHSKCLLRWSKNHNTCPICRKPIGDGDENKNETNSNTQCVQPSTINNYNQNIHRDSLLEQIIFVQLNLHPHLHSYHFNYSSNTFSWRPPFYDSTTLNRGSSGVSFGRGGASGSW